jgi:hypothetical protein
MIQFASRFLFLAMIGISSASVFADKGMWLFNGSASGGSALSS